MLSNVPISINSLTRNVVINHPNTFNCQVFRKKVTRTGENTVDGNPTLGGLAVLNTADEEQFEYDYIGNGYALPAESFNPSPMVDRLDANIGSADEFRFLIEPEGQSGSQDWFDLRTNDVFFLLLGGGAFPTRLAFEVIAYETTSNIPPYTTRYVANRRDDLDLPSDSD
jgi:hypothetical protein